MTPMPRSRPAVGIEPDLRRSPGPRQAARPVPWALAPGQTSKARFLTRPRLSPSPPSPSRCCRFRGEHGSTTPRPNCKRAGRQRGAGSAGRRRRPLRRRRARLHLAADWMESLVVLARGRRPAVERQSRWRCAPVHGLLRTLEREEAPSARMRPGPKGPCACLKLLDPRPGGTFDRLLAVALRTTGAAPLLWHDEPVKELLRRWSTTAPSSARTSCSRSPCWPGSSPTGWPATVRRGEESIARRFLYAWPALPAVPPLAKRALAG